MAAQIQAAKVSGELGLADELSADICLIASLSTWSAPP